LDNCQATDFVKFKNEIKNSTCPFTHFTEWEFPSKNLIQELNTIF
jgi:hypothetical protein